jgi:RNA polymerase sigma-70 factor (ECF subfamily)
MNARMEDVELVRQIGAGDRDAESELCCRLAPRIWRYGLRHLRLPQAAEDLVQQVLITTLETLRGGRLRDPERLVSFVLGTCRMTVLDLRRGALRRKRLLAEFGHELVPRGRPSLSSFDRDRVARCVQALKERDRMVIVMTFYDEKTSAEVGGVLGTSDANVRVIRHRAIRELRRCMESAA